jgi:isopenicillin-N N-acyltransferase-like protein
LKEHQIYHVVLLTTERERRADQMSSDARTGPHLVYDFRGSPYEIGFQHGRALRGEILAEAESPLRGHCRQRGLSQTDFLDWVVSAYRPVLEKHVPVMLEEVRGVADGSGLGYGFAFYAAVRDGLPPAEPDRAFCTAAACGRKTTRDGRVLLGQTKDTAAPLDRYRIMRLEYATGERMVLLNYPGWLANICLTSGGLSFAGNSLYAREPEAGTVPFCLIKRLVMERSSVAEVLEAIQGLTFANLCLILGDATGRLVCLESVMGSMRVRDASDRAFGHANSILDAALKGYEIEERIPPGSATRQKNIQRLLDRENGRLTVGALKRMLADHRDAPHSICQHPSPGAALATSAAYVCDLSQRELHIAIGNPCAAAFKTYRLDFQGGNDT